MPFMLRACLCMCKANLTARCWTAIVMDFNAYGTALPILEGGIDYWQGSIVKCSVPAMAGSVTEAQCHDEGICIRVEEV